MYVNYEPIEDERETLHQMQKFIKQVMSQLFASNDRSRYKLNLVEWRNELMLAQENYRKANPNKPDHVESASARLNDAERNVKCLERQIRCLDTILGPQTQEQRINALVSTIEAMRPFLLRE